MKFYFLVIPTYLLIAYIDIYSLYRNNKKREIWVYSMFIGAALIMSILLIAGVKLPSPIDFIMKVFPSLKK